MKTKVELLAPAGSIEGFYGAVHAGADAVYLGGSRFGARAYADNFTEEELLECIRYAHLFHRKVYLTVNTLVKAVEMPELFAYLLPYYEAGLDGVIVQDIGVFSFIREHFPGMELHVSTQMTITGSYGAKLLRKMGACRVVPARELSLKELKEIKQETGLEIEAFIHGAMCYCYSGQCLFSSILGGRSGNRGRCAQPCRLPYSVEAGKTRTDVCYPLSLKDMCTVEHIPELLAAGIDSFKIEGRMKRPEYTAGVTAIYRKYIDACYETSGKEFSVAAQDLQKLSALYIRSEIQNGYYFKRNGPEMVSLHNPSYGGADETLLAGIRKSYLEQKASLPVSILGKFVTGQPASVTFSMGELAVTAVGEIVQPAQKQPITRENAEKQLGKLGDSVFRAKTMKIIISGDAFYPLKQINALRREAAGMLEEALLRQNGYGRLRHAVPVKRMPGSYEGAEKKETQMAVSVCTAEQLKALAESGCPFSRIYVDGDLLLWASESVLPLCKRLAETSLLIVTLPYILRRDDKSYLERLYQLAGENVSVFSGFQVRCLEGLGFLLEKAYTGEIYTDAGIYIWNADTLEEFSGLFSHAGFCMPYELKSAEQHSLLREYRLQNGRTVCEKIVYGRIPMMVTANCVAKTTGKCLKNNNDENLASARQTAVLWDRYRKKFPVALNCMHCLNIIYNSVPLSLHGELDKWRGECDFRLDFTLESGREAVEIIRYFFGTAKEPPFSEYTTGHEKRGVL